jgi:hypothetical protein
MQHSADFTSLHSHHADVARAEWELEVRRLADERGELTTEPAIAASPSRRHHWRSLVRRTTRPATR